MNRLAWLTPWRRQQPTISDLVEPPDRSVLLRISPMGRVIAMYLRDDEGADSEGYPPGCVWYEYVSGGDFANEEPTTWLLLCKDVHEDEDTLEPLVRTEQRQVTLAF